MVRYKMNKLSFYRESSGIGTFNQVLDEVLVDEDTIISNVVCNVCKNTLPPHSIERHLNKDDKIHKCPHLEK
jgi:hypothetical protein